jgi:hypothetical protein
MIARAAAVADVKPGEGPARCRWAPNTAEKSPHIHAPLYVPTYHAPPHTHYHYHHILNAVV